MSSINILFDLDGTLVNSLPDIAGVVNWVRSERGFHELSEEDVRVHIGRGVENLVRGTFPEILPSERPSFVEEFKQVYYETPSMGGALYEGVSESLRKLRDIPGVKLAIVTNKPTIAAERTLAHYLPGFSFDEIAGPEKVSEKKPSPAHLLEVISRLNVPKETCWYIGDDEVDLECAAGARVRFLGACYGFGAVMVPRQIALGSFNEIWDKIPALQKV